MKTKRTTDLNSYLTSETQMLNYEHFESQILELVNKKESVN